MLIKISIQSVEKWETKTEENIERLSNNLYKKGRNGHSLGNGEKKIQPHHLLISESDHGTDPVLTEKWKVRNKRDIINFKDKDRNAGDLEND